MIIKSKIKEQKSKLHIKIKNFAFCIVILIFAFCILHFNCYAQPISSTELINNAKQYNGKTVVYEGEAIGDVMRRGSYAWINLHDGKNAIGIWLHRDLTKEILFTGSYKTKGDWLEVTGVFQHACAEHGGDLDIHAQTVKKIKSGRNLEERLNLAKRNFAIVLLGILIIIWILTLLKRR